MFEIVKGEKIGKVLFIVEGNKTEPNLIYKLFCGIYGYQMERIRGDPDNPDYKIYHKQSDPDSRVIVVNAKSSNISSLGQSADAEEYLDALFDLLVDKYALDIDNAAIYYLFDRDPKSNTNAQFIEGMLKRFYNARENLEGLRQGLLLLSYPCIESFTAMNLLDDSLSYCWNRHISIGHDLKQALDNDKKLPNHIGESTLLHCAGELLTGLQAAGVDTEKEALLNSFDAFASPNRAVFDCQEDCYRAQGAYGCLSLLCVALLDLGLIRII